MYNRTDFSYLFENLNLHHGMLTLEESWHELKHHLLMARELYVPKFKVPRKVQPKWFDLPSLIDYIRSLFVKCLLIGRIPSEWKNHKISPIPKNRDLLDISIYRPIPLLCILSKVLESIISSKIIDFVRPKISKQQYGFMKNKSCCSQLLSAFAIVYEALDKRNKVDMIIISRFLQGL